MEENNKSKCERCKIFTVNRDMRRALISMKLNNKINGTEMLIVEHMHHSEKCLEMCGIQKDFNIQDEDFLKEEFGISKTVYAYFCLRRLAKLGVVKISKNGTSNVYSLNQIYLWDIQQSYKTDGLDDTP